MKVQIRRGVFETNSSSTHSLQITKGTVEDAKADIISRMFSTVTKKYTSTIVDDTITLKGLRCNTGGDSEDIFTIISNWEAKLQYVASYLFSVYESYEYDAEVLKDIFTKHIIEIAAAHGVTINNIIYNVKEDTYADDIKYPKDFPNINEEQFESVDNVNTFISTVMKDEYIITFGSEAYSSYEGRTMYIIE